jgi:type VI secretion system secreted protein Hcp
LKQVKVIQLGLVVLVAVVASGVIAALAFGHSTAGQGGPPVSASGQLVVGNNTLNIAAFSTGGSSSATISAGGGIGSGKASFQNLSVSAPVDSSNPQLNTALATGQHFASATLTYTWGSPGGTPATYTIALTDVIVTSVTEGSSGSAPTQDLTFAYGKIKWTYTDASGTTTGSWDLIANA